MNKWGIVQCVLFVCFYSLVATMIIVSGKVVWGLIGLIPLFLYIDNGTGNEKK